MKVFISPHCDDETLFGAFTILRENPVVVVVFDSFLQQARGDWITALQRRAETLAAMEILGAEGCVRFLGFRDDKPDWAQIQLALEQWVFRADQVWAPLFEAGGHEHHNLLADMITAEKTPGAKIQRYLTYTTRGKSTSANRVPYKPEWVPLKLRALACYPSQSGHPLNAEHFLRSQEEYYL